MDQREYQNAMDKVVLGEEKKEELWEDMINRDAEYDRGDVKKQMLAHLSGSFCESSDARKSCAGSTKKQMLAHLPESFWIKTAIAVLLLFLCIPAGIYREEISTYAEKIKNYFTASQKQEGYQSEVHFEAKEKKDLKLGEDKDTLRVLNTMYFPTSKERLAYYIDRLQVDTFVNLQYNEEELEGYKTYVPGADGENPDGWYARSRFIPQNKEDDRDGSGREFTVLLFYVADDITISEVNQQNIEKVDINGHTGYYSEEVGTGSSFHSFEESDLKVFYPEYGYYLQFHGHEEVKKDQLIRMAKKFNLTEVPREEAGEFMVAFHEPAYDQSDDFIRHGRTHETNEVVKTTQNVDIQVTDVKIQDSFAGLKKSGLIGGKLVQRDKDGKFKKYIRETYHSGDGITEPRETVVKTEKVRPELVLLTIRATNHQKKKSCTPVNQGICYIQRRLGEEDYKMFQEYHIPDRDVQKAEGLVYIEGKENVYGGVPGRFIGPGETITFQMGFLVAEDLLDQAYYNPSWGDELTKDGEYSYGELIKIK